MPLPSLEGVSYASPSACTSGYTEQLCLWPVGRAVRCVSSHTSHSVSCNLKRERVTAVAAWTVCHGSLMLSVAVCVALCRSMYCTLAVADGRATRHQPHARRYCIYDRRIAALVQ